MRTHKSQLDLNPNSEPHSTFNPPSITVTPNSTCEQTTNPNAKQPTTNVLNEKITSHETPIETTSDGIMITPIKTLKIGQNEPPSKQGTKNRLKHEHSPDDRSVHPTKKKKSELSNVSNPELETSSPGSTPTRTPTTSPVLNLKGAENSNVGVGSEGTQKNLTDPNPPAQKLSASQSTIQKETTIHSPATKKLMTSTIISNPKSISFPSPEDNAPYQDIPTTSQTPENKPPENKEQLSEKQNKLNANSSHSTTTTTNTHPLANVFSSNLVFEGNLSRPSTPANALPDANHNVGYNAMSKQQEKKSQTVTPPFLGAIDQHTSSTSLTADLNNDWKHTARHSDDEQHPSLIIPQPPPVLITTDKKKDKVSRQKSDKRLGTPSPVVFSSRPSSTLPEKAFKSINAPQGLCDGRIIIVYPNPTFSLFVLQKELFKVITFWIPPLKTIKKPM